MTRNGCESRGRGWRRAGMGVLGVCTLALGLALPAGAADERSVKSRVAPNYPEIAKRMRIGGVVEVQATVDAEGKVTDAKAISGSRVLALAAEDAVRKWKFESGAGVSKVTVQINFALTQ